MKQITIGLFGTCGNSTWRNKFIDVYNKRGISFFNPQKTNWIPEDAQIEAEHLANDDIVLFPVTNETFAFGSLGEVGFSIMQALKLDERRDVIVMIDPLVNIEDSIMSMNELNTAEAQRKDSIKMRALVMAHLKKVKYPNVYIVDSLQKMLELSVLLYEIQMMKLNAKKYTI